MDKVQKMLNDAFGGMFGQKRKADPVMVAHRARQNAARQKAKRLLIKYPQISLEAVRDSEGMGYWVNCGSLDPDPVECHFSTSWDEALNIIETYIDAIEQKTDTK